MARILLLDDEELVRRAFARSLRAHEVVEAKTVSEAMQCIESAKPDALLLDVHLYRGTSSDFLDWLGEQHPDLLPRTAILTGSTLPGAFMLPEGVRLASKPLGIQDLRKLVDLLIHAS